MCSAIRITAGSLEERKARIQEMKDKREKRSVVLGKPLKPLSNISIAVARVPVSSVSVQVQAKANSSRQQTMMVTRAKMLASAQEKVAKKDEEEKKKIEEVRAAFKRMKDEKMKVVTPEEIRMTSIPRHRDVMPIKGCLKKVKANPYGTVSLDLGVIRSRFRGLD